MQTSSLDPGFVNDLRKWVRLVPLNLHAAIFVVRQFDEEGIAGPVLDDPYLLFISHDSVADLDVHGSWSNSLITDLVADYKSAAAPRDHQS
jgi:hypothetical protein